MSGFINFFIAREQIASDPVAAELERFDDSAETRRAEGSKV